MRLLLFLCLIQISLNSTIAGCQKSIDADVLSSDPLYSYDKENSAILSSSDSTEQLRFWNSVVIPILKKNKKQVMSDMDFPVLGDWTKMLEMNVQAQNATVKDFESIYDKFFNDNFLNALAKQSHKDIRTYKEGNNIWFSFGVVRRVGKNPDIGESGVYLNYLKEKDTFKLKKIMGAGGNFYYQDK